MKTPTYTPAPLSNAFHVDVDRLERNQFQPRIFAERDEDLTPKQRQKLEDLAASIKETGGVLQPILVRPLRNQNGNIIGYQIVDGERRWRATKIAGMGQIAAVVREMSDDEVLDAALIANDQREDLTDYEQSQHFVLIARHGEENGLDTSYAAIARRIGRSLTYVRNRFKLPELHADVVEVAKQTQNAMSSLFIINPLPEHERAPLLQQVIEKASYRAVEKQVEQVKSRLKNEAESRRAPDSETSTRSAENARSGGGNVSRGRQLKGNTDVQARAALESVLATMDGHIHTVKAWKASNPRAFLKLAHRVLEAAHKLEKLTKEE